MPCDEKASEWGLFSRNEAAQILVPGGESVPKCNLIGQLGGLGFEAMGHLLYKCLQKFVIVRLDAYHWPLC